MNTRLKELHLKHNVLVDQAEAVRQPYAGTAEKMGAEESARFDAIMADADAIWEEIEREQRAEGHHQRSHAPVTRVPAPAAGEQATEKDAIREAHRKVVRKYLRYGLSSLNYDDYATVKDYQAGSDPEGGFLVMPEEFVAEILKGVDDMTHIRGLARVIQLERAESLGVPTLDTDVNDADWTAELATGNLDEALRLGKRELTPHPLAKRTKMSRKLMRMARIDPEALVLGRIAYKFAVTQEKAFLTGTGVQQPLGLFVASADGISSSRDVTTGSATNFMADKIIHAAYSLKPQYWGSARWLMHRDCLREIRKLKDANNNYLWASGISTRTEPTIMDMPYLISEFAPNTMTDGNYAAILGDFSYYWIVEALDMQIQVLNELYAESNQLGYIARIELDAQPVLEEAFIRLKFGA